MKNLITLLIFLLFYFGCYTPLPQEPLKSIEIIRDDFGVPHIKAPTDAEVAFGLAWVQCEDDFITMQEQMLAVKGMYGEVKGKEGVIADFAIQFMGLRETVEAQYEDRLSEETKALLKGYVDGANAYAKHHPDRLMHKSLFPLHEHDLVVGYLLGLANLTHAAQDLALIMEGNVEKALASDLPTGSNAIAVSRRLNPENETLLAINSHQPLEGWYSWYEAHLVSDEGMNILGGTFPGGATIFHGVNSKIGWAHTVNHPDLSDVYRLTMHPTEPLKYKFDGQWKVLESRTYRAWVKLWWIFKIPVTRTVYRSVYGPTFKTEEGFYAWRSVAAQDIRAVEQWYRMNKASDYDSFIEAMNLQGLPSMNTVYADVKDNIYYISNGRLPRRNPNYNWSGVLPGDTSATLWDPRSNYSLEYLPQVLNPECGYVFNTNNTPFDCTQEVCDPAEPFINATMGFQSEGQNNNRSRRLAKLLESKDTINYRIFKEIKYDNTYPDNLGSRQLSNLELLMTLDATKHPDLSEAIKLLHSWDRKTDLKNTSAPLFILIAHHLTEKLSTENRLKNAALITKDDALYAIQAAQAHLLKHFGKMDISLEEFQFHSRGEVKLPIEGGPDVLGAIYGRPQDDGTWRAVAGESYIMMVRFTENGPTIETVNAFGSNAIPGDRHSTSQMTLFVGKELKSMYLDFEKIRKEYGNSLYHPLR